MVTVCTCSDGVIDRTELGLLLSQVVGEMGVSEEAIDVAMAQSDANNDGVLTFEEACSMLCQVAA